MSAAGDVGSPTAPFTEAVAEAEALIRGADFVRTEQDLAEGYECLAGSIRSSIQAAFDYDLERPLFVNATLQYARQGLDNPDAIYFHAHITDSAEYVVTGRRGTTADLSFQAMNGGNSPAEAPTTSRRSTTAPSTSPRTARSRCASDRRATTPRRTTSCSRPAPRS